MKEGTAGLSLKYIAQITAAILSYKRPEKIVIFGSRAGGEWTEVSDIDIAIWDKEWDDRDINLVRYKLNEEIKTPLKFDVVNYYSISKEAFKQNILRQGKVIYETRKN